jgi:hypothetical protein
LIPRLLRVGSPIAEGATRKFHVKHYARFTEVNGRRIP